MPTSLVTGGAGFIGSHVADNLLAQGHSVVALDDLSGGFHENVPAGALFVQGSINDDAFLSRLFSGHRFDYVFHLAAYAAEGLSHFIRRYNYENNLIGSVNLINLAILHRVKRLVFSSSIAVYGRNQLPMAEETEPRPEDPYGIAKYAVELDLRAAHELFGLDYIIFRPHNVYGERQNLGDRYRNVLGIFMNQILRGEPLTIFGDGTQTRAFTHIADVAPVIARSVEVEGARNQVFNVGSDQPCSINELATMVARALGAEPRIDRQPARNEVQHAWADHEKARRILSAGPGIPLEEGVCRMAAWARAAGPREPSRFRALEIDRGLPPIWR
ncbi:MAG TPA: NAD-dependent epimerase/dehydratase family protein [Thermoanaerobaculia bacterium]|nr:NAD-dependent epimerase/dehydratase family protein [Thermoanaerobaculia bacterium]